MATKSISILANHLRSTYRNNSSIFSISASLLESLQVALDSDELEINRDLQYLQNFVEQIRNLKLFEDGTPPSDNWTDLSKFKNLISIQINKVDVNTVKGLQKLRSQLQKVLCHQIPNKLSDVLCHCGADHSQSYCWNELKEVAFINNGIETVDLSFECTPWLHTLDLSHNKIEDLEFLNCLGNLKCLNLSYNRVETIGQLRGQICGRLQNLNLKNNFIEDITELQSLTNIWVLDLGNNCLVEHKSITSLSHLATLQWLNLEGNPLSFHPVHRIRTASCLHTNTSSTQFILDNVALSKAEKKVVGSFRPTYTKSASSYQSDALNMPSEKVRKVRLVTVEDEELVKPVHTPILPSTPQQHLETKKQIENLREVYGDSWLNSHSALMVQNVLGLDNTPMPSSSLGSEPSYLDDVGVVEEDSLNRTEDATFVTAFEEPGVIAEDNGVLEESDEELEEGELAGEENLFLATPIDEADQIFISITTTHIAEKECSTSKERVRWHVHSILSYAIQEDQPSVIQINFKTMRKNRQVRVYRFELEDLDAFVFCIEKLIENRAPPKDNNVEYQCMKCNVNFIKVKNVSVLGEPAVICPSCDSTLVVENT